MSFERFSWNSQLERWLLAAMVVVGALGGGWLLHVRHAKVAPLPGQASKPLVIQSVAIKGTGDDVAPPPGETDKSAAPPKHAWRPEVMSPAALGSRMSFQRRTLFHPPYTPLDGRTFRADGQLVVLAGVEVPPLKGICIGGKGEKFVCGLEARAALYNFMSTSAVECAPAFDVPPPFWLEKTALFARCRARDQDLALLATTLGYARPVLAEDPALVDAADRAQRDNLGLWAGGWQIISTGGDWRELLAPKRPKQASE